MGVHELFHQEEENGSRLKKYVIGCILWTIATLMKAFGLVLSQVSRELIHRKLSRTQALFVALKCMQKLQGNLMLEILIFYIYIFTGACGYGYGS